MPRGLASAPKFLENSQDKFLANEDENAYVQLEVFGDPAPTVEWFRVRFYKNCFDHYSKTFVGREWFIRYQQNQVLDGWLAQPCIYGG